MSVTDCSQDLIMEYTMKYLKKNRKNNASCFSDHNSLKVGNDNSIKDGEIKSTCLEIVRCLLNTHRSQRKTN